MKKEEKKEKLRELRRYLFGEASLLDPDVIDDTFDSAIQIVKESDDEAIKKALYKKQVIERIIMARNDMIECKSKKECLKVFDHMFIDLH